MDELEVLENHFQMDAPENVLEEYKIPLNRTIETVFRIDKAMEWRVCDEMYNYVIMKDGSFECTFYMPDIESICMYAASFGSFCTIVKPEEAVKHMKEKLKRTLHNYESI